MKQQPGLSSGFTMIEVLITVVILSIGLLGMAGIQIQGLRGTTSSTVRSQATILANDMAERIHMNFDGVFIGPNNQNAHYSDVNITNVNGVSNINCNATNIPRCSDTPTSGAGAASSCTTTQMATFDIFEFACGAGGNSGVLNSLPNGSASITCVNASGALNCPQGSNLTINISWTENNPNNPNPNNTAPISQTVSMVVIP